MAQGMGYALSPPATNSHNHQRNPMKRQRSDGEMVQGMTFGLSPHAMNHQNLQQTQLKRQRSDAGPVAEHEHKRPYNQYGQPTQSFQFQQSQRRTLQPTRGRVLPPLQNQPIDPRLGPSNGALLSNVGMDQLLITSPSLNEKTDYPTTIDDFRNAPQDGDLPVRANVADAIPPLNAHPAPWAPFSNVTAQPNFAQEPSLITSNNRQAQFWALRPTRSEFGAVNSGMDYHDSGYQSQTMDGRSVFSYDFQASNGDCQSVGGRMTDYEINRDEMLTGMQPSHSQDSHCSFPGQIPEISLETLICQTCNVECNNKSDFKKHKLRHEKPFKCDVPDCSWETGFPTANDLVRHKSSKHDVTSGKHYICAAPHCSKKSKFWPRADNFRQHVKKLHPELELQEVMDKSSDLWELRKASGLGTTGLQIQLPQDSHYLEQLSHSSQLVDPQFLSMLPGPQGSINHSLQDATVASYPSVDGPQGSMYNGAMSRQNSSPMMDVDTALSDNNDVGMNQQRIPPRQALRRHLAVPTSQRPKTSFAAQPKIIQGDSTSNGSTNRTKIAQDPLKSDHSSSQLHLTTDEETSQKLAQAVSDFAKQLGSTHGLGKDQIELVIRNVKKETDNLDSNKSRKRYHGDSPGKDANEAEFPFQCPHPTCGKRKKTQCDLKKHLKRHTRPYGCTDSSCPRRFGSKNDWKRHENSQHMRCEAWKCAECRAPITTDNNNSNSKSTSNPSNPQRRIHSNSKNKDRCNRVFYRREQFQAHLEIEHKQSNAEYVSEQCRLQRVGRNGQKAFWCGFCQKIVPLQKRGLDAWDERFTHIDVEHFKKGETVDNWFPIDRDIPKSVLAEEKKDDSEEEEKNESEEDGWSEREDEDGDSPPDSTSSPAPALSTPILIDNVQKSSRHGNVPSGHSSHHNDNNKNNNNNNNLPPQDNSNWYCRHCGHGPNSRSFNMHCVSCARGRYEVSR